MAASSVFSDTQGAMGSTTRISMSMDPGTYNAPEQDHRGPQQGSRARSQKGVCLRLRGTLSYSHHETRPSHAILRTRVCLANNDCPAICRMDLFVQRSASILHHQQDVREPGRAKPNCEPLSGDPRRRHVPIAVVYMGHTLLGRHGRLGPLTDAHSRDSSSSARPGATARRTRIHNVSVAKLWPFPSVLHAHAQTMSDLVSCGGFHPGINRGGTIGTRCGVTNSCEYLGLLW